MMISTFISKFKTLDEFKGICTREVKESFEYKNGKPTANCIGYSFAALDKDFGQISFFISKKYFDSDSLLQANVKDCVRFGEMIDFKRLALKLEDISISVFNGRMYLKVFLMPSGSLPSGVLETELEEFFHA